MRTVSNQINLYNPTNGLRPQLVSAFRNTVVMLTVTAGGTAGAKLFFRASAQEAKPDFAAGVTASNFHSPVQVKNLSDGTTINGTTGIDITTTGTYMLEVNTNLITWLGLDVTTINGAVFNVDVISGTN